MLTENEKPDLKRVGKIITERIEALNFPSMSEAARQLGVDRIMLLKWMNAKTKGFDAEIFIRLCLTLKLHPTWVLWGVEESFSAPSPVDSGMLSQIIKNTLRHMEAIGTPLEPEVVARAVTKLYVEEAEQISQRHDSIVAQYDAPPAHVSR